MIQNEICDKEAHFLEVGCLLLTSLLFISVKPKYLIKSYLLRCKITPVFLFLAHLGS